MTTEPTTWTGTVERHRVAEGSKSERTALVLVCEDRTFILRRVGQHSFGPEDPTVAGLVGQSVTVTGARMGTTLIFNTIG